MKKRRILIISLLLVAALMLGIGYAALSTDLVVNGSVSNQPHPIDVTFKSGKILTDMGTEAAAKHANTNVICTDGAKTATLNVANLVHKDDAVYAEFVIVNNNKYAVTLGEPVVAETTAAGVKDFFTATSEWVDASGAKIAAPEIAAGATATFRVKVTMDINTGESLSGDFTVTVKATSAE